MYILKIVISILIQTISDFVVIFVKFEAFHFYISKVICCKCSERVHIKMNFKYILLNISVAKIDRKKNKTKILITANLTKIKRSGV